MRLGWCALAWMVGSCTIQPLDPMDTKTDTFTVSVVNNCPAEDDMDSDGVCDDVDLCMGNDATGDSDGDGICDNLDLCTGDDATGDSDGDGVCDSDDRCPNGSDVYDGDGDGFAEGCDCRDDDPTIFPEAGDLYGDGIDSDCDGFDCEAGTYGGTYFAVCTANGSWWTAQTRCIDGGHDGLASIRSALENEFIVDLMTSTGVSQNMPWIGSTDQTDEGVWLWSDGADFSYTTWASGEPNNAFNQRHVDNGWEADEDCGNICWDSQCGSGTNGLWNDWPCLRDDSWTGFVCQRR